MAKRLALVTVSLLACSGARAPTPSASASNAGPSADRTPPTKSPILLVANKAEATLSVLELPAGRVLATLPTGQGPHEIAIAPDGTRAVVSNYGDQAALGRTLTVVDLVGLKIAKTIELGDYRRPHGMAFLDDHRVIVTAEVNASVVIVDLDAGKVERGIFTSQQGSHMLARVPGTQRVYVANIGSGSITPIDVAQGAAGDSAPAIATSEAIAVTPDGAQVWTASLSENKVVVLDAKLGKLAELPAEGAPIRVTATPDGKAMLVSNVKGSKLQVVDVATRTVKTIDVPAQQGDTAAPMGAAIASDSKTAYVTLVAEDRVAIIDLASGRITGHIAVGHGPDGIAYSSAFAR
ncbi:MAG: hypothetical protein SFX73_11220 [Kofleriaceae bacterium]|nr:hypothetical protein [Kofleriaceae bacterium]